jgi:hypothetical protein
MQDCNKPLVSLAVKGGYMATVAALIEAGANINARDNVRVNWVVHASKLGCPCPSAPTEACRFAGPQNGKTPLFYAGRKELAQLLLSHGARASVTDNVSRQRLAVTNACSPSGMRPAVWQNRC